MKQLHIKQEVVTSFYYVHENNELPDEDELYELSLMDESVVISDRLYDMNLYNMAYKTDSGFIDVDKIVRGLWYVRSSRCKQEDRC